MGLTFKQADNVRSRADILLDAPENRRKKQKMMLERAFQRLFSSVFLFGGLGFIVYCSSFYMGSFIDIGEVIGSTRLENSQKVKATVNQMPRIKEPTLLSPISEYLAVDRIYLRRGQSILASYSLPKKSKLSLIIKQCKTMPLVEIFKCKMVSDQNRTIKNKTTGFVEFTALRSGFYHFENNVVQTSNTVLQANVDYNLVWQRGGKQAR